MNLVAIMPLRNEAWIVGLSARVALKWCDSLVCLLHASTDSTREILDGVAAEHPGRVTILEETEPTWREMHHRQRLLETARQQGATHVAITDADEILTGNLLPIVRSQIAALQPGRYLQAGMPCMWRALDQYRVDGRIWANRRDLVLAFADSPSCSWRPVNGYDHHHREPLGSVRSGRLLDDGGVMHLQWASWRRLAAKQSWYQMHERLRYPDKPVQQIARQYSAALDETGLRTLSAPESWWEPYRDLLQYAELSAEPWHEGECKRLVAEYGSERFAGLNLHGVEL